jgi:hypothetical protein
MACTVADLMRGGGRGRQVGGDLGEIDHGGGDLLGGGGDLTVRVADLVHGLDHLLGRGALLSGERDVDGTMATYLSSPEAAAHLLGPPLCVHHLGVGSRWRPR